MTGNVTWDVVLMIAGIVTEIARRMRADDV